MIRRRLTTAALVAAMLAITASPALAGHDHFIETPNGNCHQVAMGQTAIADASHGGYHRFHTNVHVGATDGSNRDLGHGNSVVNVYKDACPQP